MYVAKDLHGTMTYEQLRRAVNALVQDERARPNALGRLVTMVLNNINTNNKDSAKQAFDNYGKDQINIDCLMEWRKTNEGHKYWERIHGGQFNKGFNLFPQAKAKPIHKLGFKEIFEAGQLFQHVEFGPVPPEVPLVEAKKPVLKEQPQKRQMKWWGAV